MKALSLMAVLLVAAPACKRTREATGETDEPAATIAVEDAPIFPAVDPKAVQRLEIERPGVPKVVLQKDSAGVVWNLVEPVQAPADARAVAFAINELRRMEWEPEPLTDDPADWAGFGADPEQAITVRITQDGKQLPPLHLGREKAARVGVRRDLFRVHHVSYFTFARDLKFWRDRTISKLGEDEVTGLTLVDGPRKVRLVREPAPPRTDPKQPRQPDGWTSPAGKVDQTQANHAHRRLLDLEAADLAEISLERAGLTEPARSLHIERRGKPPLVIELGKSTPEGGTYVRVGDNPRVMVLDASSSKLIAAPINDWLD